MDKKAEGGVGMRITSDPDITRIHSQTDVQSASKAIRIPLRLLLVSDLFPEKREKQWDGPSRLQTVDRNSYSEFIRERSPKLRLDVPNRIGETPRELEIELAFQHLDDFHPLSIARQVPALTVLLDVRRLVENVRKGDIDLQEFRTRLQELGIDPNWAEQLHQTLATPQKPAALVKSGPKSSASTQSPQGNDPLDRLLGMVDIGSEKVAEESVAEEARSSEAMEALMQAVTDSPSHKPVPEASTATMLVRELDEIVGDQINEILGNPKFRKLEAAWRGLKFLVDRIPVRDNIQLEILAAGKTDLDEALYHQVLIPEHTRNDGAPVSAILLDFSFGNEADDISRLEELADTAASLQVPIIGSVATEFFGLVQSGGLARLPVLWQHLDRPEYLGWQKLRSKAASGYLALALPSFLLRFTYGSDNLVKEFAFTENGALWGNASLFVGAAIAAGFARSGWPTTWQGPAFGIENLPVFRENMTGIPLAAAIPEKKQEELADAGFVVLSCYPNQDKAYVAHAPVVHKPDVFDTAEASAEARAHVQLSTQLFVSRAAQVLLLIQNELEKGMLPDSVKHRVTSRLASSMGVPEDSSTVEIEYRADMASPEEEVYAVRLRPPVSILSPPVSLVMGLYAPK